MNDCKKIEVGLYSWKEICAFYGWETTGGTYRKARYKKLSSMCEWVMEGRKIRINKVYENKIPKYKNLKIEESNYNSTGVYIIIDKENNCYIGSTIGGFKKRFLTHFKGTSRHMKHTYDLLHENNAEFRILEDMTGKSEYKIRKREQEYINKYSKDNNYNIVNHYNYVVGFKPKPKKKKNISINEENYELAIKLLQDNSLI